MLKPQRQRLPGPGVAGSFMRFSAILFGMIAAFPAAAEERVFADAGCELMRGVTGRVEAILDATTLRLEGGAELRLAGVEPVPPSNTIAEAAMADLAALALGQIVEVRHGAVERDRYGRLVGHVYVSRADGSFWLQAALAMAGDARVEGYADDTACLGELLAAERVARDARLGLWPAHPPLAADDPALRILDDGFALVEGILLSIGRRERTVYLNFGDDWSTDYTVSMTAAVAAAIEAAGGPLDALVGQGIRIRGWLTQRDGPWIRVDHAAQIEILDVADAR